VPGLAGENTGAAFENEEQLVVRLVGMRARPGGMRLEPPFGDGIAVAGSAPSALKTARIVPQG
jgi:hypothetical protein